MVILKFFARKIFALLLICLSFSSYASKNDVITPQQLWHDYHQHFVAMTKTELIQGMLSGRLPKHKMQQFVVQDSYYLLPFARAMLIVAERLSIADPNRKALLQFAQEAMDERDFLLSLIHI